jgi:hypothetical protein
MATMATTSAPEPTASLAGQVSTSPQPVTKTFKSSELPLPSATRSAIEALAHSFKKKGGYDATRQQLSKLLEEMVCLGVVV